MTSSLTVQPISAQEHLAFVTGANGSFLQTPAWGQVKSDWTSESIGWFDGDRLVGAGLVLFRQTPVIRRFLAYLPEGPVIDWRTYDASAVTAPLLAHLKQRSVFTVKIGPQVAVRTWHSQTLKQSIADADAARIGDVGPDVHDKTAAELGSRLRELGWQQAGAAETGFGDLQPRYVFQVPLEGRTLDDVFSGFNQLWRRNVRKAEKSGVVVEQGGKDDLRAFHEVYVVTAERDGFNPRPLSYFQRMWEAMRAEDPDRIRLYLARHDGDVVAATTWVKVGNRVWYSYGASSNDKREVRGSNAIQWRMMQDAHEVGAAVYDLRGISDTLDEQNPLFGLLRFKLGTSGEAVEYVGEWDYPIRPLMHKAFEFYLARR